MSTTTSNYDLVKPELGDPADITAMNSNWDTIDNKLGEINDQLNDRIAVAQSEDGVSYTAKVDEIKELYPGLTITFIPNITSNSTAPTLNLNDFGAISIRQPTGTTTTSTVSAASTTWLVANTPVQLMYNGTYWVTHALARLSTSAIYGTLPISKGGTGATTAATALTKLGAMHMAFDSGRLTDTVLTSCKSGVLNYDTWESSARAKYYIITVEYKINNEVTLTYTAVVDDTALYYNFMAFALPTNDTCKPTVTVTGSDNIKVSAAVDGDTSNEYTVKLLRVAGIN